MTTRVVTAIEEWVSEPFTGGYAGLHDLADDEFSGVVKSGTAKACFLNGAVVGVLDGSIDDFGDASGTVYEAPYPALPLLALMQERSDEVRAKYYSEDTPIVDVDDTLSDGGFSGYIELSENVLSGDYYVVYHGGRSMAAAYVGNTGQLLTGDEAFDRADDEVGIYEVRPVEIDPVEIPEPASASEESVTTAASGAGTATDTETGPGTAADTVADAGEATDTEAGPGRESDDRSSTSEVDTGDEEPSSTGETDRGGGDATGDSRSEASPASRAGEGKATQSGTNSARTRSGSADAGPVDGADTGHGGEDASDERSPDPDESPEETATADTAVETGGSRSRTDTSRSGTERDDSAGDGERRDPAASGRPSGAGVGSGQQDAPAGSGSQQVDEHRGAGATGSRGSGATAADRVETHSIPSLDPSRSTNGSDGGAGGAASAESPQPSTGRSGGSPSTESTTEPDESRPGAGARGEPAGEESRHRASSAGAEDRAGGRTQQGRSGADAGSSTGGSEAAGAGSRVADLERQLDEREARIERLESELATAEEERDELERERDRLQQEYDSLEGERERLESERDELEAELADLREERDRLQSELDSLEEEFGARTDAERRLSPGEALDATNLFVRYESKGQATLEAAHDGSASRSGVAENLGLEYHTQFEAPNVSVGGQPFDEFLESTIQFRFVTWVVHDLLFEIRETGKASALKDLYDAIPQIDRAELNGVVDAAYTEDGQERRSQESFDVVLRDRMGNPLIVANLNDSRQAATESMMNSLVTASSHVSQSEETMAASVFVTSSFFEPEALETAADATSGGLLSRDKRESFVKLSRKRGYHLCLVEAREGKFHLAVPEL
ncbi:MAG: hypothetical protein ABEJ40_02160 [Haloarculaceae archaeon]